MNIRTMRPDDVDTVSSICIEAFSKAVAPTLPDEGVCTFKTLAAVDSFAARMQEDNVMLVFEQAGTVRGVVELKQGRHIAMLFVDPGYQKHGMGRALMSAALGYAREDVITVSASLTSVPAYISYGFECSGEVSEQGGLVYQPMELKRTNGRPSVG